MTEKKPRTPPYESPDGLGHSRERDRELNDLLAAVFRGAAGEKALNYLTNITINRVCGPDVPDSELRHLEGQRHIVAVIRRRIEDGRDRKPRLESDGK